MALGGTTWTAKVVSDGPAEGVRTAKVGLCGSVLLSELWNSLQLSQTQIKSEVKVYVSGQSYD